MNYIDVVDKVVVSRKTGCFKYKYDHTGRHDIEYDHTGQHDTDYNHTGQHIIKILRIYQFIIQAFAPTLRKNTKLFNQKTVHRTGWINPCSHNKINHIP